MANFGIRVAAVLLLLTLLGGCQEKKTVASRRPTGGMPPGPVYTVAEQETDDLKAVLATVRSKKVVDARVRTPGTIVSLRVTEGVHVEPGQVLGVVADPKLALRIKASDAQIAAIGSRLATARADFERQTDLLKRGAAPQSRLDQAKTAFDVATNDLASAQAERGVLERQTEEGQVLAPSTGRIIRVPVTEGAVVMAGESIATIAANEYLLRLEVPERHARFMKQGDTLKVGQRGLGPDQQAVSEGRIVQVYPEIQNGRVIADAELSTLGDYFVGERTLAWISAGKRLSLAVPRDLTFNRYGLDYVRLAVADQLVDVVVQLGQPSPKGPEDKLVEVLAGLKPGDKVIRP
ncbi:MAG: efflux RND transporter periplasmic adaptor subunit [Proteobacteria bacterium]|nr:efflux RND transporter periplasmic adaptor subunit [Pseudomonadota bacterium]